MALSAIIAKEPFPAATKFLRRLPGGSQPVLIEASDGHCYVLKFRSNPQGARILVNEIIAGHFLSYLDITAAPAAIIQVSNEFLKEYPVAGKFEGRGAKAEPGLHFGSRHPSHPHHLPIWDFIPQQMLNRLLNPDDFIGALVFDKWCNHHDGRQAIFFSTADAAPAQVPVASSLITAWLVDNGHAFGGPEWDNRLPWTSPYQGLSFLREVYKTVRKWDDFEPWLSTLLDMPESVIGECRRSIPREWIESDEYSLDRMLESLWTRRQRVPDLLRSTINTLA